MKNKQKRKYIFAQCQRHAEYVARDMNLNNWVYVSGINGVRGLHHLTNEDVIIYETFWYREDKYETLEYFQQHNIKYKQ